jgi:SH3-like domain-containing protein
MSLTRRFGTFFVLIWFILAAGSAIAGERMAAKSDIANVRSGPGTTHEVLWQIEKYHPVSVVEKRGAWFRFRDFEGDQGWIHASLLDNTRTVIVRVRRCNVRSGPGTDREIAFTVDRGIPFKVLQKKGRWYEVEHADGDRGWIFETLVW